MWVAINSSAYEERRLPAPRRHREQEIQAICDSGAQMCMMGPEEATRLGMGRSEYTLAAMTIYLADNTTKKALGMVLLRISGVD